MWRAAGLTSEPAQQVVVVLCRQVGEDVLDPPPKLEAENQKEHKTSVLERKEEFYYLGNSLGNTLIPVPAESQIQRLIPPSCP